MKGLISAGGTKMNEVRIKQLCKNADIVVAADSGIYQLIEAGCIIDYVIGDMDSLEKDMDLKKAVDETRILKYPVEKDKTDTELAADYLINRKCKEVIIIGGIGTRLDHSIANIQLLRKLSLSGVEGKIIDDNNEISYLPEIIEIESEEDCYYSVLPLGKEGVVITLKGFYYPLDETLIPYGTSLGISNYMNKKYGTIIKHQGEGFLVKSKD